MVVKEQGEAILDRYDATTVSYRQRIKSTSWPFRKISSDTIAFWSHTSGI